MQPTSNYTSDIIARQNRNLWGLILLLFSSILAFGTIGYVIIEHWGWFDSLYMTVITMATVGFLEVHPLSSAGRVLTMLLIFLGVTVFVIATSAAAQLIFQHQFFDFFSERKMIQQINQLKNHVVVCGFGRMSRSMIDELLAQKMPVVLIDSSPERIEQAKKLGVYTILGDAADEDILKVSNINNAQCIITLVPKDAENLYIVMSARELVPNIYIVCRCEDETAEKRLIRAGANRVISPYRVGGQKIARAVLKPNVFELMELATQREGESIRIEEIRIPNSSPVCNKSIQELDIRKEANVIILSLVQADGSVVFNPSASEKVSADTTVVAMGSKDQLAKFESIVFG
jgi:voltage-gated potassium channel